jgi:Hemin uptake protein hemP
MNAHVEPWLTVDATPVHDARVLTEGGSLARIVLDGQVYSLRITRAGKLILTKWGRWADRPPYAGSFSRRYGSCGG